MELQRVDLERLPFAALLVPVTVTVLAAVAYAGYFLRLQHPVLAVFAFLIVISAAATAGVIGITQRRLKADATRISRQGQLLAEQTAALEIQKSELDHFIHEVRSSEARSRLLLAAVQEGVMLLDEHQNILAWNQSAERIFGLTSHQATSLGALLEHGRIVTEAGGPTKLEDLPSQRAMTTRIPQPSETFRYIKNSGETLWLSVSALPLDSPEGDRGIVAVSFKDVTAAKKAETSLQQLNEQLSQAQKMEAIGRLAGGVAHDFNNLLTVIVTYSELLKVSLDEGTSQRSDVDEIASAARRATALTRQLLAFSRRQVLNPEDLDMSEVLRGMLGMISRLLGEDIEVVTKEAANLSCTHADRGQIEQVIANLAINARDAMPNGGVLILETAEVEFDVDYGDHDGKTIPAGRYVQLCVSDTGEGMDAGTRSRIFDPFFTTKPPGKGTGLGLSTVIGIVSQSNGYLSVYSTPNMGTTFKIYLPALQRQAVGGRRKTPTMAQAEIPHTGRLLLVEDDPAVRKATTRLLERMGFQVHAVDDPLQALEELSGGNSFDLMLTDMVMPHMNGNQLAREALAKYPDMRVVIMSGYSEEASNRNWALPSNIVFVEKPVTREALSNKLREAMRATV